MNEIKMTLDSIAYFIVKEKDFNIRKFIYQDFKHKLGELSMKELSNHNKEEMDVAVFCTNRMEFEALETVFPFFSKNKKEYKNINGLRVWKQSFQRELNFPPLNMIFILIGDAGNISCTRACMRVFDNFNIKFAVLTGIAAGLKGKVKLYDTAVSSGVIDYEHQRLSMTGTNFRPDTFLVHENIKRSLPYILGRQAEWRIDMEKYLNNIDKEIPIDTTSLAIKTGIIASGEKLFADGVTLAGLAAQIPSQKGIIAGEMEGSGFTQSCEEFGIPWIVFRGISDFGGKEKDQKKNKDMQIFAALSAVLALKNYLKYEYRTKGELEDF